MAIKYTNMFHIRPSKIYPNWNFWFKKCHLATLDPPLRPRAELLREASGANVMITAFGDFGDEFILWLSFAQQKLTTDL
jgi:hypothetical protein